MTKAPTFAELLAGTITSALHLEMRDTYTPDDLVFQSWLRGEPIDTVERHQRWRELIGTAVARGVAIRRARIVSEPVTDYIRFEHAVTGPVNVAAGEEVRWLPRRLASDLCLPGNDFWVFDDRLVRFHHFEGDGTIIDDDEFREEPDVVRLCTSAFEAVWSRAVDHSEYKPS